MKHIFLCFCLIAGINAFAADEINGIYYNLSESTAEVASAPSTGAYKGNVVIPATFTYDEVTYTVTSIGDNAFSGCKGITSITIPASVTSFGKNAFSGCTGLTAITIPAAVTSIGEKVFSGCTGLTSITIPASLTSIGNNAFYECKNLASLSVEAGNPTYSSPNNCNAIIETATNLLIVGCQNTVIPATVTSIGSGAFYGNTGLASITIPANVTNIGSDAFSGCTGLTSVALESNALVSAPMTTQTSMKNIFGAQVQTYTLGNTLTEIGTYAFYGCSGLTSITIPSTVKVIGSSAFSGCKNLASITIPAVDSIANNVFYRCGSLTSVTIPSSVKSIGNDAFALCRSLTSINIPENVDSIANFAFYGCTDLASVTFSSNKIKSIGNDAFAYCASLTSITLPNGVKELGTYIFYNCSKLNSVTIPNSVTNIKDYSFGYCLALKSVSLPSSVEKVSTNAFYESGWYQEQEDGVLYLGTMAYGYKGDIPYDSIIVSYGTNEFRAKGHIVEFNPGTKIINESAFEGNLDLWGIIIPESLDTICSTAFAGCLGLSGIFSFAVNPPKAAPDAFGSLTGSYTDLVVYDNAVDEYKAHPVWGKFQVIGITEFMDRLQNTASYANQFGGNDADAIRSTNSDAWTSEVYDLSGRRQNTPQRGLNIVRMSDGTTRKVMIK